jgi:hypothetical protein
MLSCEKRRKTDFILEQDPNFAQSGAQNIFKQTEGRFPPDHKIYRHKTKFFENFIFAGSLFDKRSLGDEKL